MTANQLFLARSTASLAGIDSLSHCLQSRDHPVVGATSPLRVLTSGKANKKRKFVLTPGYNSYGVCEVLCTPGYLRIRDGKSKNAKRTIPLTDKAAEMLRNRKQLASGDLV